jgi:hypothetical protein
LGGSGRGGRWSTWEEAQWEEELGYAWKSWSKPRSTHREKDRTHLRERSTHAPRSSSAAILGRKKNAEILAASDLGRKRWLVTPVDASVGATVEALLGRRWERWKRRDKSTCGFQPRCTAVKFWIDSLERKDRFDR